MIVRIAIFSTNYVITEDIFMNNCGCNTGCLCSLFENNWIWLLIIALLVISCCCH